VTEDAVTRDAQWAVVDAPQEEFLHRPVPVVAVVGRPNVGKSTLVNRLIGRRQAAWRRTRRDPGPGAVRRTVERPQLHVVDTGGWEPDAKGPGGRIAAQAEIAVATADVVLFVVDPQSGPPTSTRPPCGCPAPQRPSR